MPERVKVMKPADSKAMRQQMEAAYLSPGAARSACTRGRRQPEEPCPLRTDYQRDRDRILHCSAFRRLRHKTQVFLAPQGDHYRTRLTHTLEVSQIARTIASGLRLNEDLTEAIALGHDLGHTPFGHAGERALDAVCPFPFRHHLQSVRVVDRLSRGGRGLNLTWEVRNGIACHSAGSGEVQAATLEGRVVRLADKIAYLNHDIEDAIRAGILSEGDLPWEAVYQLGRNKSVRITTMIFSILECSDDHNIRMAPEILKAHQLLSRFMFETVYVNPEAKGEEQRAEGLIQRLYAYYMEDPARLPEFYRRLAEEESPARAVCDYISGMTDQYAVSLYQELTVPKFWTVL